MPKKTRKVLTDKEKEEGSARKLMYRLRKQRRHAELTPTGQRMLRTLEIRFGLRKPQ